jgi:hypothetical protein
MIFDAARFVLAAGLLGWAVLMLVASYFDRNTPTQINCLRAIVSGLFFIAAALWWPK